jgi:hypothetical protein
VKTVSKTGTDFQNPNRKEPDPKLDSWFWKTEWNFCQRFLAKRKEPHPTTLLNTGKKSQPAGMEML